MNNFGPGLLRNSSPRYPPLPLIELPNGELLKFKAIFNGRQVCVEDPESIMKINLMGCFGKGSLSRCKPRMVPWKVVRQRQWNYHKDVNKLKNDPLPGKEAILVVADSDDNEEMDDSNEDEIGDKFLENVNVKYTSKRLGTVENLQLMHEEALFLMQLGCLRVYKLDGTLLSANSAWLHFKKIDKWFIQNYIVYHFYKSKNWVVKTGLKFAGDFLLYQESPEYSHSTYVIIIDILNIHMIRDSLQTRRSMRNMHLLGLNRLCETAGKQLLIAQIIWPEKVNTGSCLCIQQFRIREIIYKRWQTATQNNPIEDGVGFLT